jgi:hypothetical protein
MDLLKLLQTSLMQLAIASSITWHNSLIKCQYRPNKMPILASNLIYKIQEEKKKMRKDQLI